jgi:hypothetical protein
MVERDLQFDLSKHRIYSKQNGRGHIEPHDTVSSINVLNASLWLHIYIYVYGIVNSKKRKELRPKKERQLFCCSGSEQ